MDQFPFEINITIIGSDVFDLIELLRSNGFDSQASDAERQVNEQMS